MTFKKEYIILTAVIAALVLYLATGSLRREGDQLPQPAELEKTDIDRLVVTRGTQSPVELVEKDERWLIEPQGYPADQTKVKNMINAASDLTLTALVAESGNYDRYGLTAGDKIMVRAFSDGAAVREFSIGKAAPTQQHTFVLMNGDTRVYHARGQLQRTFGQSIDGLRDKTIFDIDKEEITSLSVEKDGKTIVLTKTDIAAQEPAPETEKAETPAQTPTFEWRTADGRAVDRATVDRLLDQIDHLDCDAFAEEGAEAQPLGNPRWSVSFGPAEDTLSLSVYPKRGDTADQLPATASTTPYTFLMNQSRIDTMEKHLDGLLGIEEAPEGQ